MHNLTVLRNYQFNLGKVLKANRDLPLGPGNEFEPPRPPQKFWSSSVLVTNGSHPHAGNCVAISGTRQRLEKTRLTRCSYSWQPQRHISNARITSKTHGKVFKYSYRIPVPIWCVMSIPELCTAPMIIMAQNMIDELGRIVPKDRLTHDQSWKWSSSTSVNSCVQKELLQACHYGFCIHQLVNWAVAARRKHPNFSAYWHQKLTANWLSNREHSILWTALQTATQLPEDELAIITLCLTFGGAPCSFEYKILSKQFAILQTSCCNAKIGIQAHYIHQFKNRSQHRNIWKMK